MEPFIELNAKNIADQHICCAFSDKKCKESYGLKKDWLRREFDHGYVFRRIDARAKVMIEYGPAEKAWVPVDAPDYLLINCFGSLDNIREKDMQRHYYNQLLMMPKNRVRVVW